MARSVSVVDLFAGPGGLGEGFASLRDTSVADPTHPFRIALSVEKEPFAHRTLRLRSFFRAAERDGKVPDSYYEYAAGRAPVPFDERTKSLWEESALEARQLEIGRPSDTEQLTKMVRAIRNSSEHWVLVGGPPCQAYSVVGRARNSGNKNYEPHLDKRHFLYKHYLALIRQFQPSIFVMENVKGILSSKVNGKPIFERILADLHEPGRGAGRRARVDIHKYRIYSLSTEDCVYGANGRDAPDPLDYVVAAEKHGIPQSRHRVILLGIRNDLDTTDFTPISPHGRFVTVAEAIGDLPKLRSGLSKGDSYAAWSAEVLHQAELATRAARRTLNRHEGERFTAHLARIAKGELRYESRGGRAVPMQQPTSAAQWISSVADNRLDVVLNHETRGHMAGDLGRYLFAAAYGAVCSYSPRARDFPVALAPAHENWNDGDFQDRFRVQLLHQPATTVTCHMSKDGHYYIHPDVEQCRSLTVREAARLQTFPDNYFFEGNRSEQYIQVGNAVPPMLARQIAARVWEILNKN